MSLPAALGVALSALAPLVQGAGSSEEHPIAAAQETDGSWRGEPGTTALALLVLIDGSSLPGLGPHGDAVERGLRWLVELQDEATGAWPEVGPTEHLLVTQVLIEAAWFTERPELRASAQRAVDHLGRSCAPDGGVPLRSSERESHPGATALAALVLSMAADAELTQDADTHRGMLAWLAERTARTGVVEPGAGDPWVPHRAPAVTALTALARLSAGELAGADAERDPQLAWLREHPPSADRASPTGDPRYLLYGSWTAYRVGGRTWKAWSGALKPALVDVLGSDEERNPPDLDPLHASALRILTMQVYYRYGRLYAMR